jgi:transcription initiation factor TFIIB
MAVSIMQNGDCDHLILVSDESVGEQICKSCGQVMDQNMVDYSHDVFNKDFQNTRTGPKITNAFHNGGLSTMMGKSNYDSSGKPISYKLKGSMNRMRMWDSRSKITNTANRNLLVALLEISKLKEKMSLSDAIIERSAYFYRRALEKKLIRGRTVKGIAGACVYAACRELGTTRSIIEIATHMQERRKGIARSYGMLFKELSLEVTVADPLLSIVRFSNNLGLSEAIKRDAINMLNLLKTKKVIAGKRPNAVAATIIYMACIRNKEDVSQAKIAEISGITGVTIRTRLHEFKKHVSLFKM